MVHVRSFLRQPYSAAAPMLHVPDRSDGSSDQDQKQSSSDVMGGEVFLGDLVLALSPSTIDDRNPVRSGEATHPTTEPTGHSHQVGIVEFLFGAHQPSPPLAETTSRVAQPEVRV